MTAIGDFCNTIRSWLNREDYSDELITSWVRMAEERINEKLRIDYMVQIDTATIASSARRVALPSDWISANLIVVGGIPYRYEAKDSFYGRGTEASRKMYTISGRYIVFGGPIGASGVSVEMHYYGKVPQLGNNPTWLSTEFTELLTFATLSVGYAYGLEEEKGLAFAGIVNNKIESLNASHLASRASGSRLTRKTGKGFG